MHLYSRLNSRSIAAVTFSLLLAGCSAAQPAAVPVATSAPSAAASDATATPAAGHEGHDTQDHGTTGSDMPFDAAFIDDMIKHHQGAIEMAEMALQEAEHEELRTLSEAIVSAQSAEIEQMQAWRDAWYPDLAPTEGMQMEMGDMAISDDESKPFDHRFLEAMISHHHGALDMAKMALEQAEHEEIRALAETIIAAQEAEIAQMQQWLEEWAGEGS